MRPELDTAINSAEFRNYYWLKDELKGFCKQQGIPVGGSKQELTERICRYLETGEVPEKSARKRITRGKPAITLSLDSIISEHYKNDENHRKFFTSVIGRHFKFNVPFMKWMKEHHGKTYREAVSEWNRLYDEKKSGKKREIASQFEYNRYTRDFFAANSGKTRKQAIRCWNYKKSQPGSNAYEDSDLDILE